MRRPGVTLALLLVAGTAAASFTVPSTSPAAAQAAEPEPVTLTVELTRDISNAQSLPWVESFVEPSLTTVQRRSASSAQAREHLLAGEIDAAIIGTPFTSEERAEGEVKATIEVPIHVSTAMLLMSEPVGKGFEETKIVTADENPDCDVDPTSEDFDPEMCSRRTTYKGPVRIPHANLAAMMLGVATDGLNRWQHPDVKAAMGIPNLSYPIAAGVPTFIHREPGESVNLYVQKYITTAAPKVWELAKLANTGVPYEVDESVSRALVTRSTPTFQAQLVGVEPQRNAFTQGTEPEWASNMADIPPAVSLEAREANPTTPYKVVQMKNGADQWVEPTPESIAKAVAAGGNKPLFALTNRVDGAYPLVWVDNLSVAAKGLSPAKANAVASFVRYVATLGQKGAAALGEGKLSPALVTQALEGADAIVKSNCEGAGVRVVSTTDLGPYAPPSLSTAGLAKVSSCVPVEAETPAPPADPGPDASSPVDDAPLTSEPELPFPSDLDEALPAGDGETAAAPLADTPAGPANVQAQREPKVKLPFAVLAASARGVDRLATILIGAVLFLLLRATIWPRICKRLG